jgi:mono/diheme cytochrome c family protein
MNPSPAPTAALPVLPEPHAERRPVPVWLLVLTLFLIYLGMIYFDQQGGWFSQEVYAPYHTIVEVNTYQPPSGGPDLAHGRDVYERICGLCHGNDGMGKPNQAPAYVGSEWALGSPNRMIRIPLVGLTGPIEVSGQQWSLSMPAMGASLSDNDLAAVLTYIRQSWGNKASEVTPDQVAAVRKELGNRSQPETVEELKKIP